MTPTAATGIGVHTQKEDKSERMKSTCISPKVLISYPVWYINSRAHLWPGGSSFTWGSGAGDFFLSPQGGRTARKLG